jgi:predicted Zn finger-like uncharacterized protein
VSDYRLSSTQGRSRTPRYEGGSPTTCPACQSSAIVTTEKKPDASSYWRCESCGEVWNDARLDATRHARRKW